MDPNLSTEVDAEEQRQQVLFKQLYDSLKPTVWVLILGGKFQNNSVSRYCTAFAVTKDGLLMSSGCGNCYAWRSLSIDARRLDGNAGFNFLAELVTMKRDSDIFLFKVIGVGELNDTEVVTFGSGDLNVGENVICIAHPHKCAGAGLLGRVIYQCIKDTEYRLDDDEVCSKYNPDPLIHTSLYRKLGDFLNKLYFFERQNLDLSVQRRLQANLPVIHCSGLVGGEGCCGASIFNFNGELVGMFFSDIYRYELGIHVSAMKMFLDQHLDSQKTV